MEALLRLPRINNGRWASAQPRSTEAAGFARVGRVLRPGVLRDRVRGVEQIEAARRQAVAGGGVAADGVAAGRVVDVNAVAGIIQRRVAADGAAGGAGEVDAVAAVGVGGI